MFLERCVLSADALCALLPVLWRLPFHRLRSLNTDFPQNSWPYLQVGADCVGHLGHSGANAAY